MKIVSINRIIIAVFIFLSTAFLFSCQKETSQSNSTSITEEQAAAYSDESAQANGSFDDVADISMTAADEDNTASVGKLNRDYHPDFAELRAAIGLCATIAVSPNDTTYPKK
jgi:hypothetical protein